MCSQCRRITRLPGFGYKSYCSFPQLVRQCRHGLSSSTAIVSEAELNQSIGTTSNRLSLVAADDSQVCSRLSVLPIICRDISSISTLLFPTLTESIPCHSCRTYVPVSAVSFYHFIKLLSFPVWTEEPTCRSGHLTWEEAEAGQNPDTLAYLGQSTASVSELTPRSSPLIYIG